ncbi:MAG: Hsp20/alpha crystallin family protein [Vulcanimicrobiota bacterium]
MKLTPMTPFRIVNAGAQEVQREFDRMLNRFFGEGGYGNNFPQLNISEREDAYRVEIDLPGIKKENVEVKLDENRLTIRANRQNEEEKNGETFHRVEKSYGSFVRSLVLPENVDRDRIDGKMDDGVLSLTLPKTEKTVSRGKTIELS